MNNFSAERRTNREKKNMNKKEYMTPEMEVMELKQQCLILAGSTQGLNDELQSEEVEEGFAPFFNGLEL